MGLGGVAIAVLPSVVYPQTVVLGQAGGGISFLGKNSLIIMCIHEPIKRVLLVILSKVTSLPIDNLRGNILLSIICVLVLLLVCVPIINIINKKLAWMIGKF